MTSNKLEFLSVMSLPQTIIVCFDIQPCNNPSRSYAYQEENWHCHIIYTIFLEHHNGLSIGMFSMYQILIPHLNPWKTLICAHKTWDTQKQVELVLRTINISYRSILVSYFFFCVYLS
jgi:hypothetical protein